jgi:DNA gyrase subunit A
MGRGGQGYTNIETEGRNGQVAASFAVEDQDHVILMTDGGTIIRCPVHDIRIAGRRTQGVTIVKTQENEKVVSVTRLSEDESDEGGEEGTDEEAIIEPSEE